MKDVLNRRKFIRLPAFGGVIFASGLIGRPSAARAQSEPSSDGFLFVELTEHGWGFEGVPNPDAQDPLKNAITAVDHLAPPPDFIIFTGRLTHAADDPVARCHGSA